MVLVGAFGAIEGDEPRCRGRPGAGPDRSGRGPSVGAGPGMSRPGGAVRVWETAASALLVALAVVLSATGSAGAPASGVAVDPAYGPPLTNVKVSGTGFCRTGCSAVSISVGSLFVASDVAVQADGTFSTIMRMPGTVRPGDVTITASQTDQSGATASARTTFSVTTGSPAPTQYPAPTTIQPPTGSPPTARPPQNVTQPAATGGSTTLAGQPGQPGQPSSSPATTADQAGSGTTTSVSSTTGGRALSATPVRHRRPDHTALFVLLTFILLAATAGGGGWWYHRRHTAVP